MALFKRRLQPSYRERVQSGDDASSSPMPDHPQRLRRRWGSPPTERVLIGYVMSLALMVALANLPLPADLSGGGGTNYSASGIEPDEPLALITVQDLSREDSDSRSEDDSVTPEPGPVPVLESDVREHRSAETPLRHAAVMRPVAAAHKSGTPSAEQTRKLLRFTGGPPAVDIAPKVRSGSMIVRYPLSALKKAIEGLVIVRFTVEPNGRASGVEVLKGLDPACDQEVVEAVEHARFYPGEKEGKRVPAYSQMTVRFVLAESSSGIAF